MSTRTASQANFSSRQPRKRQKRSNGLKTPTNWDPYSNAPIPIDTDGFVYCDRIKDMTEFDNSSKMKVNCQLFPQHIPKHVYLVQILDRRQIEKKTKGLGFLSSISPQKIKKDRNEEDISDGFEYYVHFYAFDRRLDDWFDRSSFRCHLSDDLKKIY